MSWRPFVFINMAISIDGKITSVKRERPLFTSQADKDRMDVLRAKADAIVNGAESIRAEDPPLHIRQQHLINERLQKGKKASPMPVIVTQSGNINPQAKCFSHSERSVIATCNHTVLPSLLPTTEVWRLGNDAVDITQLLTQLKMHGVEQLLLEGGGNIAWHFMKHRYVDELYVTFAPAILGGQLAPTLVDGEGFAMRDHMRLQLLNAEVLNNDIFTHYKVEGAV